MRLNKIVNGNNGLIWWNIREQVRETISNKVREKITNQVINQVWDQVREKIVAPFNGSIESELYEKYK